MNLFHYFGKETVEIDDFDSALFWVSLQLYKISNQGDSLRGYLIFILLSDRETSIV